MPGRLMDQHDGTDLDVEEQRQFKRQRIDSPDAQINGPVPRSTSSFAEPDELKGDAPPEIVHITEGFYPLSRLLQRLSQECATDFGELLEAIPASDPPQPNGLSAPHAPPSLSSVDAQRKRLWMDFAKKHRDRFTKALVLVRWSAQAQEASRLIDVATWLHFQTMQYHNAVNGLGEIKKSMTRLKIPSPDIETAVDVLSRGTVARAPDLGYIPPSPLSATKLLKSLRNLNTLLHIRLARDEALPSYLRSYKIHSGRVTFTAPSEFELDVSIASDDPASQFYLIDFRLLFTPHTDIPPALLHGTLEPRANAALATEGLVGCFQLLRDFVLTHKINLLRRQAIQLNSKEWAGSLRVESTHRSLNIQYWKERAGGKNWIEIGVKSGVAPELQVDWKQDQQPRLCYRCFRAGKEVTADVSINLRPDELDVERIVKSAIAQHSSFVLASIDKAAESRNTVLRTSNTEPRACSLEVSYDGLFSSRSLTVVIESLSGRIALQPWTQTIVRYEDALNRLRDPASEVWPSIRRLQTSELQREAEEFVVQAGFTLVRDVDSRHTFPAALRARFFRLPGIMAGPWILAWTLPADQKPSWSVVELDSHASATHKVTRSFRLADQTPANAHRLALAATSMILRQSFEDQLIARHANYSISADGGGLQFTIERASVLSNQGRSSSLWASDDILIDIMSPSRGQSGRSKAQGRSAVPTSHVVYGQIRLSNKTREALKEASSFAEEFKEDGTFALALRHELGSKTVLSDAVSRLRGLQRLCASVDALCSANLKPQRASFSRVDFCYSHESPELQASIVFSGSHAQSASSLQLEPANNPHKRILKQLRASLATSVSLDPCAQFDAFLTTLQSTLPIVRALQKIEDADTAGDILIDPRTPSHYRLAFPALHTTLKVFLAIRRDVPCWTITHAEPPPIDPPPSSDPKAALQAQANAALSPIFDGKGPDWLGMKTGVIAVASPAPSTSDAIVAAARVTEGLLASVAAALQAALPAATLELGSEPGPAVTTNGPAGTGTGTAPNVQTQTLAQAQNIAAQAAAAQKRAAKPKPGKIELPSNPVLVAAQQQQHLQQLANGHGNAGNVRNGIKKEQEIITLD